MKFLIDDSRFKIHLVAKTVIQPEQFKHLGANGLAWLAAHRDVSEELSVVDNPPLYLPATEAEAGERLAGQILKPGHFGVLEHFGFVFECCGYPHSVISQARTHRVSFSFDVQSQRYTGDRVLALAEQYYSLSDREEEEVEYHNFTFNENTQTFLKSLEDLFYTRPPGYYTDRKGVRYEVTSFDYYETLCKDLLTTALNYDRRRTVKGQSEEAARGVLGQDVRQGWFMSTNIRGLLHFLDLRYKKDAQLEIRDLAHRLFAILQTITPEICLWYEKNRLSKNKIAP